MTLSGIELRYLVNEISKKISEYYVSNIYGISRNSILFKLHHPEKPDILLMFSTFGFWITTRKIEQIEENRLVKRLRNDLLRSKISEIKQIGTERIAYITFSGLNQEFILVGEFFGDGNIVLCNKEMKILSLLHSIDVRHRKLNVGLNYELPPLGGLNIFEITLKDISDIQPFPVGNIENKNSTRVTSFMEGLDLLFTENLLEAGKTSQSNSVTQQIEEFEHRLEEQTKAISKVNQRTGLISAVAKSLLE